MDKDLEFKIKVFKHFDIDKEEEVVEHYIKKKSIFGWWYVTVDSSDDWFSLFMGTLMLDALIVIVTVVGLRVVFNIDIASFKYFVFLLTSLRLFWFLMCFKILKKKFDSREDALEHIKNIIRKSKLEKYNRCEDIKITYKEGNLEVEK